MKATHTCGFLQGICVFVIIMLLFASGRIYSIEIMSENFRNKVYKVWENIYKHFANFEGV